MVLILYIISSDCQIIATNLFLIWSKRRWNDDVHRRFSRNWYWKTFFHFNKLESSKIQEYIKSLQISCTLPYCHCANTMIYHHWIIMNEIVIIHSSLDNHQQNIYDHNAKIKEVWWISSSPSQYLLQELYQKLTLNLVIDLASILLVRPTTFILSNWSRLHSSSHTYVYILL